MQFFLFWMRNEKKSTVSLLHHFYFLLASNWHFAVDSPIALCTHPNSYTYVGRANSPGYFLTVDLVAIIVYDRREYILCVSLWGIQEHESRNTHNSLFFFFRVKKNKIKPFSLNWIWFRTLEIEQTKIDVNFEIIWLSLNTYILKGSHWFECSIRFVFYSIRFIVQVYMK